MTHIIYTRKKSNKFENTCPLCNRRSSISVAFVYSAHFYENCEKVNTVYYAIITLLLYILKKKRRYCVKLMGVRKPFFSVLQTKERMHSYTHHDCDWRRIFFTIVFAGHIKLYTPRPLHLYLMRWFSHSSSLLHFFF